LLGMPQNDSQMLRRQRAVFDQLCRPLFVGHFTCGVVGW
jgi:hypothetical protein